MIRRTRRGDIVVTHHTFSTRPWFHFAPGAPLERVTVMTAPAIPDGAHRRLSLVRGKTPGG